MLQESLKGTHKDSVTLDWNNLRTLSLVNGVRQYLNYFDEALFGSLFRLELPDLKTFCVEWPSRSGLDSLFLFLENHRSLTEVYFGGDAVILISFMTQFEKILSILRCLKVLSLRAHSPSSILPTIDGIEYRLIHDSLETIIIKNVLWYDRNSPSGIGPVIAKLDRGELPACKVIELGGDYFDGCIDANIFSNRTSLSGFRDPMRICKQHGVALVNETGQELFFWAHRHGIRYTR
jgi:hypothetical protein